MISFHDSHLTEINRAFDSRASRRHILSDALPARETEYRLPDFLSFRMMIVFGILNLEWIKTKEHPDRKERGEMFS